MDTAFTRSNKTVSSINQRVRWPSGLRRQVQANLNGISWSPKGGVSSNLTLIISFCHFLDPR